jgi:hypothetical protein
MNAEDLDEYTVTATRHAAICLLWQASDAGEYGHGYPISGNGMGDVLVDNDFDYVDRVIPLIQDDVEAFIADNIGLLTSAGVSAESAGHNLILTANHHGTGFWDSGLGEAGRALTDACKGYSFDAEFRLWDDDADDDKHCSDELAWLMVENTVLVVCGCPCPT